MGGGKAQIAITGSLLPPLIIMAVAFIMMGGYLLIVKAREVAATRRLEVLEAESADYA